MSTLSHPQTRTAPAWLRHGGWFVLGASIGFLLPYLGISVLDLQYDLFYLLYFAATAALLIAYVRTEHVDVRAIVTHAWPWSVGLGIAVGAIELRNVLSTDATDRPDGAYFAFELLWRGATYGAVDALLLSAFPGLIAYSILHGRVGGWKGKLRFTALALPLVLLITATYHLGYPQYREDGVGKPEVGNTVISVPVFATANPIGSLIAHATMHTTAVAHSYETDVFLPPETEAK
jgi:hypothetical protein